MERIPLFPLGRALFPAGVLHLRIFEVRYLNMVRQCIADGTQFGVVGLIEGREVRTPEGRETLAGAGTLARIADWRSPMPALIHLRCVGTTRFEVLSCEQGQYGLWTGEVRMLADDAPAAVPPALLPSANALGRLIATMQKEGMPAPAMPVAAPFRLDESGWVADRWGELLPLTALQRQRLLTEPDPVRRLEKVQQYLDMQGLLR